MKVFVHLILFGLIDYGRQFSFEIYIFVYKYQLDTASVPDKTVFITLTVSHFCP